MPVHTFPVEFVNLFMLLSGGLVISVDICVVLLLFVLFCNLLGSRNWSSSLWATPAFVFFMLSLLSLFCSWQIV